MILIPAARISPPLTPKCIAALINGRQAPHRNGDCAILDKKKNNNPITVSTAGVM
jgi:hypothetical protein